MDKPDIEELTRQRDALLDLLVFADVHGRWRARITPMFQEFRYHDGFATREEVLHYLVRERSTTDHAQIPQAETKSE